MLGVMLRPHRRPLMLLLLWLALAWLPLRGVAQVTMHLPAGPAAEATAPCHGHDEAPSPDAPTSSACSLCDLCHGAALPAVAPALADEGMPPMVAAVPRLHGLLAPRHFDRPPRG